MLKDRWRFSLKVFTSDLDKIFHNMKTDLINKYPSSSLFIAKHNSWNGLLAIENIVLNIYFLNFPCTTSIILNFYFKPNWKIACCLCFECTDESEVDQMTGKPNLYFFCDVINLNNNLIRAFVLHWYALVSKNRSADFPMFRTFYFLLRNKIKQVTH